MVCPEGDIATAGLGEIQAASPTVEIGSYPFLRPEGPGTTIVFRGTDQARSTLRPRRCSELAARLGADTRENPTSG